jgi:hypothetical protein
MKDDSVDCRILGHKLDLSEIGVDNHSLVIRIYLKYEFPPRPFYLLN